MKKVKKLKQKICLYLTRKKNKFIGITYFYFAGEPHILRTNNSFGLTDDSEEFQKNIDFFGLEFEHYYYMLCMERLSRGNKFVYLYHQKDLLCSGWISFEDTFFVSEIDRIISNKNKVLLYDFSTPESFRNKGYYTELLSQVVNLYSGNSISIYALKNNIPSLKAIKKVGFRPTNYEIIK